MIIRITACAIILFTATFAYAGDSTPAPPPISQFNPRTSFFTLATGNGHGFQVFDTKLGRLITFLDHPYRFLRPASDERQDGIERRNLLEDFRIGFRAKNKTTWFEGSGLTPEYLDQTGILHVKNKNQQAIYFSPFGAEANALVVMWRNRRPVSNEMPVASLAFHLGGHAEAEEFWKPPNEVVRVPGGEVIHRLTQPRAAWVEQGNGQGTMLYIPLEKGARGRCGTCRAEDLKLEMQLPAGDQGWSGLLLVYVEDPRHVKSELLRIHSWLKNRGAARLLADERAEWERWRKPVPSAVRFRSGHERKLWRQSEAVLRMSQVREPNVYHPASQLRTSHGMVLASLAPGHWTTGWVRDGIYATVAMAHTGHFTEAKKSLDFMLNAEPVAKYKSYVDNYPYRISVTRYYGNGAEEGDYSGAATPNVELDGWGLYLWGARQYLEASGNFRWLTERTREGSVYEAMHHGVARAIESQLEPSGPLKGIVKPDSSIWEVHQENARHFAFTSLAAVRGLCDFAWIAKKAGDEANAAHFSALAQTTRAAFFRAFTVPEGHIVAAVERSRETDLDTAVAEIYGLGIIQDFTSPVAELTLAHLQNMKLPTGGYYRVAGTSTYQTNEWPFIDLRMAGVFLRMNQRSEAEALIERLVKVAAKNYYLLPELLIANTFEGQIGDFQGSNPMVGYGAGAFMMAVQERDGIFAKNGCE